MNIDLMTYCLILNVIYNCMIECSTIFWNNSFYFHLLLSFTTWTILSSVQICIFVFIEYWSRILQYLFFGSPLWGFFSFLSPSKLILFLISGDCLGFSFKLFSTSWIFYPTHHLHTVLIFYCPTESNYIMFDIIWFLFYFTLFMYLFFVAVWVTAVQQSKTNKIKNDVFVYS